MVRHVSAPQVRLDESERAGLSVVLVPGVLALLPEYAGLTDPVAELRAACLAAVGSLTGEVRVVASEQGRRVAEHLLDAVSAGSTTDGQTTDGRATDGRATDGRAADGRAGGGTSYLVVGNGSAMRTEKAPGHLDERAAAFDEAIEKALRTPDPAALADLDEELGAQLWADVSGLRALGGLLTDAHETTVDYADDPFGVQYWVMRWRCDS